MDPTRPTDDELHARLAAGPEAGTSWRHAQSGGTYVVAWVALREADLEPVVVYRSLATGLDWCRPVAEFLGEVEVEGLMVPRFVPLERREGRTDG